VLWMRENGAKFSKIRMKYYGPDYRGVHTCKAMAAHETFLWVPKSLIITPKMGRETIMGSLIKASGARISWIILSTLLCFYLSNSTMKNPGGSHIWTYIPKLLVIFLCFIRLTRKNYFVGLLCLNI